MADFQQHEKAFQRQKNVFLNKKQLLTDKRSKKAKKTIPRYVKDVGLGFKTPKEASEGTYIDNKCPFTGTVSIRGGIISGKVTKMKMTNTIVIRREYLKYIKKYKRYEKRHKNLSVHMSPCFRDCAVGDNVTVGECRPLAKTVRHNVVKVTKSGGAKKGFSKI